jgi:uncharacterized protein (TIGR02246 family)
VSSVLRFGHKSQLNPKEKNVTKTNDEKAIRSLVDTFVDGWNAHDGATCAKPFAVDADFTAITGLKAHGRDVIARGHDEILSTIYRGTRNCANVQSIRFLRPDVAVVDVIFSLRKENGQPFELRGSSCGMVVIKEGGNWSIAVLRNMIPFERPAAGPLERELKADSRRAS